VRVAVLELPFPPDPELAYRELFADEQCRFWLDSGGRGRFSYLGTGVEHVRHRVADGTVTVTGPTGVRRVRQPFLAYLDEQLRRRRAPAPAGLPFAFTLGYVGYLGYELKAETGGAAAYEAPTPDAALVLADRMLAVDHRDGRAWLLTESTVDTLWLDHAAARLAGLDVAGCLGSAGPCGAPADATDVPWLVPRHDRNAYLDRVRACLAAIAAGESYELCLTNEFTAEVDVDPPAMYAALRRISPVPYVIRTLVATPGRVSFGVGGAVVADSDPAAEHAEAVVKSRAMTAALLRTTRERSASAGTPGW
jgi:para-aminobenzoate synthetase